MEPGSAQLVEKQNQLLETDIASTSHLKTFRAREEMINLVYPDN